MRLDLAIYDCRGKARGFACLSLDLDANVWVVEADSQRAWRGSGFSQSGPIEAVDDDVLWLWEQEIGNPRCNTAVLTGIPVDRLEPEQSGSGRIVTGQVGKFHGGTLHWRVLAAEPAAADASPSELPAVALAA